MFYFFVKSIAIFRHGWYNGDKNGRKTGKKSVCKGKELAQKCAGDWTGVWRTAKEKVSYVDSVTGKTVYVEAEDLQAALVANEKKRPKKTANQTNKIAGVSSDDPENLGQLWENSIQDGTSEVRTYVDKILIDEDNNGKTFKGSTLYTYYRQYENMLNGLRATSELLRPIARTYDALQQAKSANLGDPKVTYAYAACLYACLL